MREILSLNAGWVFAKGVNTIPAALPADWEQVIIPHCWNAVDGQDGGNDYFRGPCCYVRPIKKADLPVADRYYVEINGANSSATLYINGKEKVTHHGGYSTWRVDITEDLAEDNLLALIVDNSPNSTVYPQVADFTFYGGIYRNVNLICVNNSHFDLDYYGGKGLVITPTVEGSDAKVDVTVYVKNLAEGQVLRYTLYDHEENPIATQDSTETSVSFTLTDVHLWHGRRDPYLYCCEVELVKGEEVLDNVCSRFGCRTFQIDPNRGFILNGEEYPLRGVSRHQDRWGIGNALLPEHHIEDMDLICEVGCTTIRLAHYQHDQFFYDLCDERGLVIWAEIPYISQHMAGGRENTITQMKELVIQNYNHPSIVVWGLSNEITMKGAEDPDLLENHRILNDLVHEMDKTRLTTMACVSMLDMHAEIVQIPDVVSYNHYFGWYGGDTTMNGPWFDRFHAAFPNIPIGCSEYGCEALNWHNSNPQQGDYSEEYQSFYHEELIKQLYSRPYMWATHVWNMFDFGADARAEGGENGQNHKGLVTFDRTYKKDSFYAYKAWLSDEPFVHLCGKRYIDRVEDVTRITVYSNLPEVELFANGVSVGKVAAPDHFFYFEVKNEGETKLEAVAGEYRDESIIRKVEEENPDYRLKEEGAIINWFEITMPAGRLSINNKLSDIMATFRGKLALMGLFKKVMKGMKGDGKEPKAAGFTLTPTMMEMMGGFTLLRLAGMIGMVNVTISKEELLKINRKLNRIKVPKKK